MRAILFINAVFIFAMLAAPAESRICRYRELADIVGEKVTMSAKVDVVEPDEDDPKKRVFIMLDNSTADHCFAFLTGVPKSALGSCKEGTTVTATGRVYERFDAWWGLEKVTAISCN